MLTKGQKIVYMFSGWVVVVLSLLLLIGSLRYDYFFVLCYIGFLIIVELSGPYMVRPKWKSWANIFIIIGAGAFVLILAQNVLNAIGITI
jgi:glucan phosphoethanolaminetransferase (alkaline phosphatase superfamily)